MLCYGVIERDDELSGIIAEGFKAYGCGLLRVSKKGCYHSKGKRREEIVLISGPDLSMREFAAPEVIVFAPGCDETAFDGGRMSCGAVIMPGELSVQTARLLETRSAISYGMSRKDTLTVSSVDEGAVVLSLQRELMTINNKKIDRQDMPLKTTLPPEVVMAAAVALILGGIPASFLEQSLGQMTDKG